MIDIEAEESGRGYKTISKDFELNLFTVTQTVCKGRKLKNAVNLPSMVKLHRSAQQQTGSAGVYKIRSYA